MLKKLGGLGWWWSSKGGNQLWAKDKTEKNWSSLRGIKRGLPLRLKIWRKDWVREAKLSILWRQKPAKQKRMPLNLLISFNRSGVRTSRMNKWLRDWNNKSLRETALSKKRKTTDNKPKNKSVQINNPSNNTRKIWRSSPTPSISCRKNSNRKANSSLSPTITLVTWPKSWTTWRPQKLSSTPG